MIERFSSTTTISYNSDIVKKANYKNNLVNLEVTKEEKELNIEQLNGIVNSLNEFVQPA
ncbi:hypothetical protein J2S09_002320 [Bacillus fengqiuensis]|nr:hypothetical protein [Bacillus fengqiuensis]